MASNTTENTTTAKKEEENKNNNLSFILHSPNHVTFEQRPMPALPTPHSLLLSIAYTGICGSDIHYWTHGRIGSFILTSPMVLGHESAGVVVSAGPAVKSLKPGDRVAIEPGAPCRHCTPCLSGHYNLCVDMKFAATPPYDGTLAGFYTAEEDFCYKLPEHVSLKEGALIEPLAVGVHVVRQAGVAPGQSVVVMGAGPVGLLCCAVAKAFGASVIVAADVQTSRLEFAKEYAATHTFMPERVSADENAARLLKETGLDANGGADVVIDASGAEPSIQACVHVVRRGGTFVQAGMGKSEITFPIVEVALREVTLKGSFRYGSGDYKLAVELVGSGKVDVKRLISRTVGFEEAEEAFGDIKSGRGIKVLIAGPEWGVEEEKRK